MDSDKVGRLTEAKAIPRLLSMGLEVSIPFGDTGRYDVVVDDGSSLSRVQIKTAYEVNNRESINADLRSRSGTNEGVRTKYYKEHEIDAYLIYYETRDEFYWVDFEEAPKSIITLTTKRRENVVKEHRDSCRPTFEYKLSERFK